jgi:hypothetical protein
MPLHKPLSPKNTITVNLPFMAHPIFFCKNDQIALNPKYTLPFSQFTVKGKMK